MARGAGIATEGTGSSGPFARMMGRGAAGGGVQAVLDDRGAEAPAGCCANCRGTFACKGGYEFIGTLGGDERKTGWLMIGGPPKVGGHPEGPQPAPQRPGTTANQVTAHNAPVRSASLRMIGTPFRAAMPKKCGSGRRAHEDIDLVGLPFGARYKNAGDCRGANKQGPTLDVVRVAFLSASGPDHSRRPRVGKEQIHDKHVFCTTYNRWLQITK